MGLSLSDIGAHKGWIVVAVCLLLAGGYWMFMHRAKTLPPIVLKDAEGAQVTFETMSEGKEHTVLVFMLGGCSISKFSVGLVNEQHEKLAGKLAFAGLFFGTQDGAEEYAETENVPFPVYGLREGADPFALNELIAAVGSAHGMQTAIYGGTVVVVDSDRKVVLNLAKDGLRELPKELADLVD